MMLSRLFIVFVCLINICWGVKDEFYEELYIKPLYNNNLYTFFQFTTILDEKPNKITFEHCHLFPRSLGEILSRYDVEELHISLTAGLWRYKHWGYPFVDASPGVELWAWFKNDINIHTIDRQWKDLANSLSGLFCASLNFIDSTNSYSPHYSIRPTGTTKNTNSSFLRYATLPREIVCTENLTPWKKLLPCDSHKGLASLLNSGYIHNNRYHSLSLTYRQILNKKRPAIELKQTVSLVYDYLILLGRNWSFRKLFGQGLFDRCPASTESNIYIDITSNSSSPFTLKPEPHQVIQSKRGPTLVKYDLKRVTQVLNIESTFIDKEVVTINAAPYLHANQYLSNFGQESGVLVHKIYNNYWDSIDVVLFKNLPWYLPIYLHTLKIEANGQILKPVDIKYRPGISRVRPYQLELLLRLPPRSTTIITVDFDYVFLKWQEYPPDANHGFYIGSSILKARLPIARNYTALPLEGSLIESSFNVSKSGYLVEIRTESLIITLPTPDFSMPYNVICLACTVVALAFGPLHNITTKKMVYKGTKEMKGFVKKLKAFLKNKCINNEKDLDK